MSTEAPAARRMQRGGRRQRAGHHRVMIGAALLLGAAVATTSASREFPDVPIAAADARVGQVQPDHVFEPSTAQSAGVGRRGREVAVPILTYHVIASPPRAAPYPGLYVRPAQFIQQVRALAKAGWHGVTLDQVEAHWTHGAPLPRRPIVLTFDNGYLSQYAIALPILRRMGWLADENIQLTELPPAQGGLSRRQVRALIAAGWELDTQGMSHADLVTLSTGQLHHEVADARRLLRHRFGVPVTWFCYPSGHYDARVIAAVAAAGYTGSTTTITGWARLSTDWYRLPRIRVLGGTSGATLLREIDAARTSGPPPAAYS